MRQPSSSDIKATEGKFSVIRHSAYRSGTSEKVEWRMCERINGEWKLIRECQSKRDAVELMYIFAKV